MRAPRSSRHTIASSVVAIAVLSALLFPTGPAGAASSAPFGWLDGISAVPGGVRVKGWAIDRDAPTRALTIRVYVNGRWAGAMAADRSRPDVGRVHRGTGSNHGFDRTIRVSGSGSREVCAYAVNHDGRAPHRLLGCRRVTLSSGGSGGYVPFGWLDAIVATPTGAEIRGWAIDPDTPVAASRVRVYAGSRAVATLTASRSRPDVGAANPGTGTSHGFSGSIELRRGRSHQVCAWILDDSGRATHRLLGCRTIAVPYLPSDTIPVSGRGWGHGRGMGQHGALGYAVLEGWSTARILDHFYGGTVAGTVGNDPLRVHLTRLSARAVAVTAGGAPITVDGTSGAHTAIRVAPLWTGETIVQVGETCAGPWTTVGGSSSAPRVIRPPSGQRGESAADDLQICDSSTRRHYAGHLEIRLIDGRSEVLSVVPVESYLRGVVPREIPSGWAEIGDGAGAAAVRAQAVAARSYAASERRSTVFNTCDTVTCQLYEGRGSTNRSTGVYTSFERSAADAAIAATKGQVRRFRSTGTVARTEFSSSSGGHTAGGTFPPVPDAGDRVTQNTNHRWTGQVAVRDVRAAFGAQRSGQLLGISIGGTDRVGPDGGRVTSVRLRFTDGELVVSGSDFRFATGLKSTWFRLT